MDTATARLAARVRETRWQSLTPEVQRASLSVVFDALPAMVAGAGEEPARIARSYARRFGGEPMCTVIGGGFRSAPTTAAYLNGIAGHVLDYEPMWHPATHPTSPVLPVTLALAEWQGRNGRDILTALVAGFEVQTRLLLAMRGPPDGLHPPGVVGVMGAAAAAGWLLGFDERTLCMALGIAGSRAGSLLANAGTMTKSSHCGNAARMGLEAALLVAEGSTAHEDILGALNGYGQVFLGADRDSVDPAADYGRPFRIHDPGIGIKKYPSQYGTQRAVDAALAIVRDHAPAADDIASVLVSGPPMAYVDRPRPDSGLAGKFSFQYVTAVALLDGAVRIGSFSDDRRWAADVEALLPRIRYQARPDIPANFDGMWIETVVTLRDGRELRAECRRPTGIWGVPLTDAERDFKARDCLSRALPAGAVEEVLGALRCLDQATVWQVRALLALLR
ncbi:MAG: MmgE/PrpD family protein [Dehalococcoidia bacterium]